MRVILAAVVGLVVGGASSALIVGVKGAVFHWEMAGMFISVFSALGGAISGGLSAVIGARIQTPTLPRMFVGLCVGAGIGLTLGVWIVANSSVTNPRAPEGIAFWSVTTIVVASGLSGLVGGLLARIRNTR